MSRNQIFTTLGYPVDGGDASTQTVAYTGTAGRTSAGVGTQTRRVMVTVTTAAFVAIGGSTITATTGDVFLVANTPYVFDIRPGQYVSAIQSATGGNMYVTELES